MGDENEDDPRMTGGGVFEPEGGMAVWVQAAKCATCIFWPGNRMHLNAGRVKSMLETSIAGEGHITCHDTLLYSQPTRLRPAVCRGYFDHPVANERSLALRTGRAFASIHYQVPSRKGVNVLLSQRIASTGITMSTVRGPEGIKSTGWHYRRWDLTFHLQGRTFDTWVELGNPDEIPTILECLDMTLSVARRVLHNPGYEAWAQEFGGDDQRHWQSREQYAQSVEHTARLGQLFQGGWEEWMEDTDPSGSQDEPALANLDLAPLAPGQQAVPTPGVGWLVPDAQPDEHTDLTTWVVLACMASAHQVAGRVIERDGGYQAASTKDAAKGWFGPVRPFREQAINDVKGRFTG